MRPAAAGAAQPRLVLRLCRGSHPMTVASSGCSTSSTSSRCNASRSGPAGGSGRPTLSTCCRTCSSSAARPATSGQTTARSSRPRPCASGSSRSAHTNRLPRSWQSLGEWLCESFNARLRDELFNGEIFYSLADAKVVIEGWRRHYNALRPHSALGHRPPAPEVALRPALQSRPAPPATPTVASAPIMN
jgi:transposase InsO family protein